MPCLIWVEVNLWKVLFCEAVGLVDMFIESGVTIVETRGRLESHNSTMVSQEPALFEDLPVLVLINNGSASASEVVAGAFQDLDRAVIMGETSFGKGLVQSIQPLSYNTSLKMTVSKYYTPSGRSIQSIEYLHSDSLNGRTVPDSLRRAFKTKNGRVVYDGMGIEPDLKFDDDESSLLDLALQQNNQYFFFVNDQLSGRGSLDNPTMPDHLFDRFAAYLIESDFTFETPVDRHLNAVQANVQSFSDREEAEEHLRELHYMLRDYKESQIYENRSILQKRLEMEWISQTHDERNRVREFLALDDAVNNGIELLENSYRYRTELRP